MSAVVQDIYVEQGATFIMAFQYCQKVYNPDGIVSAGTPYNLTSFTCRMQIRKKQQEAVMVDANTTNGKIIIGKDPNNQSANPVPSNGWIFIEIPPEDTSMITVAKTKYDIELQEPAPSNRVFRLFQGDVVCSPNITQAVGEAVVN